MLAPGYVAPMSARSWREILMSPAPPRHLVLVYETDIHVQATVAAWVAGALRAGGGALLVGRESHREGVLRELRLMGIDVAGRIASGRLVVLDAQETLSKFVRDDVVLRDVFRETVTGTLRAIRQACPDRHMEVRAWGEMVNLLHEQDEPELAAALERQWDELMGYERVHLICSYEAARLRSVGHALDTHDTLVCEAGAATEVCAQGIVRALFPDRQVNDPVALLEGRGAVPIGGPPARAWLLPLDRGMHGIRAG